jgi:uncharacterized protein YcfL
MRMLFVTVLSMVLAGCSASQQIAAPQASVQAQPGAAFLADTTSTIVTAASSKRTYQISVALPDG